MQTGTITDSDMIFFYMSMLDYLKPDKVLDIGMFLKRAGFVSRQAMGAEIPGDIILCGVDFYPEHQFAIYEKIYDVIMRKEFFFGSMQKLLDASETKYDVAILLGMDGVMNKSEEQMIFFCVRQISAGVMTDINTAGKMLRAGIATGYHPVSAGEKEFAWVPFIK